MKKTLAALATAAGLIAAGTIYPAGMIITEVDPAADLVTMETATGHAYQFKGVEDWTPGDLAAVIMYDGGTREDVRDDQILKVRYSGSLEQFAGRLK